MRLPIRLAAARVGIPWRTVYHYIKTGRLTAERDERGRYRVRLDDMKDLRELRALGALPAHRVFSDLEAWVAAITDRVEDR